MHLSRSLLLAILLVTVAQFADNVSAQERQLKPLTENEISRARQIEREALPDLQQPLLQRKDGSEFSLQAQSSAQSLVEQPAVRENRQMEPVVSILGAPGLISEDAARRVSVTRFDYSTGLVVTTVIDLDKNKVLSTRSTSDRPAPLGVDEFERAVSLARKESAEIAQVVSEFGLKQIQFQAHVQMDSRRSSPQFGHRLVLLWAQAPRSTERVLVDLTADRVIRNEAVER
jgi:hypothetical protein